jgi:hypothetical protein
VKLEKGEGLLYSVIEEGKGAKAHRILKKCSLE